MHRFRQANGGRQPPDASNEQEAFPHERYQQAHACRSPGKRRGLAPLELVLALPLMLFVMAFTLTQMTRSSIYLWLAGVVVAPIVAILCRKCTLWVLAPDDQSVTSRYVNGRSRSLAAGEEDTPARREVTIKRCQLASVGRRLSPPQRHDNHTERDEDQDGEKEQFERPG